MTWVAIVPAKGTPHAKSRLVLPGIGPDIATAFVFDTVSALRSSALVQDVFVVTADEGIAVAVQELGAIVIQENSAPAAGGPAGIGEPAIPQDPLNRAIAQGITAARDRAGEVDLAIVVGDLACLATADVDVVLTLAREHRHSMIPDKDGTGTTILLARAGEPLTPRFGMGSRVAHESSGHVPLDVPLESTVRRDVDTAEDLTEALSLGVGPYTRALIARTSAAMAAED